MMDSCAHDGNASHRNPDSPFDLTTRPLLPQHDCATTIEPNDVERVLTDINADYGNRTLCCRSHGVLLVLAPLASLSLVGQEHGRTIPLADVKPGRNPALQQSPAIGASCAIVPFGRTGEGQH